MKKHLIPVFGFIFVFHFASIAQIFILQPDGDEGKDTEIWSHAGPLSVLGDRESINVYTWTNQGMLAHKRALIEFDLSPFNPNMGLIKALLSIYYNPSDIHESVDVHSGDNAVFIERIISEWTEHGPTWASQPATTTQNRIELPQGEIFSSMQEIDLGFLEKSVYLFWIVDKQGLNAVKKLVVK